MNNPQSGVSDSTQSRQRDCKIATLRKGDRIDGAVFLVEEANFKQTRDGKYFIQMVLRDRSGSVRAVRWEATRELFASFSTTDVVRIRGRVEEFQQNLQVVVDRIDRVDPGDVEPDKFLPASARSPEDMEQELLQHIDELRDQHIKSLLLNIVGDPKLRHGLLRCPAGKAMHHAYVGGLLEHALSLVNAAKLIGKNYPRLNVDMLVAAAVLHDIGKVRELSYDRVFGYTDEGQLVGHIGLGLLILEEKAASTPGFPDEYRLHLQHIIASHHGTLEFGAMKLPMTPEAIAFHFLDNLDAKLAMVDDLERGTQTGKPGEGEKGRWTEFKPALSRRIYFPGERPSQ